MYALKYTYVGVFSFKKENMYHKKQKKPAYAFNDSQTLDFFKKVWYNPSVRVKKCAKEKRECKR